MVVDQNGRIVARARTVQVMYDYASAAPVPMSDELKARLSQPMPR